RRHTISTRYWSSDVCSSDLFAVTPFPPPPLLQREPHVVLNHSRCLCDKLTDPPPGLPEFAGCTPSFLLSNSPGHFLVIPSNFRRSEERRVGKACTSRMVRHC